MLVEAYNIYALKLRPDGPYYFGQTTSSVKDRWQAHVQSARGARPGPPIVQALREHGPQAFDVLPLLCGLTRAQADEWERTMVERFEARGVLNDMFTERARARVSVRKRGVKASAETRVKQSQSQRARWAALTPAERASKVDARVQAGAAARRGLRRIRTADGVRYVPWGDVDPVETRRAAWRAKAQAARNRRKAQRGN